MFNGQIRYCYTRLEISTCGKWDEITELHKRVSIYLASQPPVFLFHTVYHHHPNLMLEIFERHIQIR